jgi:hypothetical protein
MNWDEKQQVVKVDSTPNEYENSGIVLMWDKPSNRFGISSYSHCSCDGSWSSTNTDPADWEGDLDELITIVRNKEDIGMRGRPKSEADYDYHRWAGFYNLVIKWLDSGMHEYMYETVG